MSAPLILALMSICFLFFGYLGVPVPFALLAGVFVGATLADVSLSAIVQKIFDGVDNEALLAIPFFLLVGELMSSANVVVAGKMLTRKSSPMAPLKVPSVPKHLPYTVKSGSGPGWKVLYWVISGWH